MKAILGAHMSIAGGYHKAVEAAAAHDMDCVQLFTKNNNQWRAKPITDREASAFREAMEASGVGYPLSHASYLINMASPDEALRAQSVDAMEVELQRATQLGIPYVVVHPGSFTTSNEQEGIARICESIDELHRRLSSDAAMILLENTAGQGSNLGWRFEQLGAMISGVKHPDRLGVCFDTCHAFAAGYPMETEAEYRTTFEALDAAVGLKRVLAFHLNDSKGALGSRKDRHEHIGKGAMVEAPFARLLRDLRFIEVPKYLETPKDEIGDSDWDTENLETLRRLAGADSGAA